jgi:acetoin utilization deacetylase AcuC-like enzyme
VHQGNGTAEIFANDDSVFTFSMHQGNIYPIPKAKSDLDIDLGPGIQDGEYIERLTKALPEVFRASRPEIVFFQAGADTMEGDKLAGLKMTRGGIVRRDAVVIDDCSARKIPVVMTLGGGYNAEAWRAQYQSISRTIREYGAASPRYAPRKPSAKERVYTK